MGCFSFLFNQSNSQADDEKIIFCSRQVKSILHTHERVNIHSQHYLSPPDNISSFICCKLRKEDSDFSLLLFVALCKFCRCSATCGRNIADRLIETTQCDTSARLGTAWVLHTLCFSTPRWDSHVNSGQLISSSVQREPTAWSSRSVEKIKKSSVSIETHTMTTAAVETFAMRVKPSSFDFSVSLERGREEVRSELGRVEGGDGTSRMEKVRRCRGKRKQTARGCKAAYPSLLVLF